MTDTTKPCAAQGPGLSEALDECRSILLQSVIVAGATGDRVRAAIIAADAALAHPVAVEQSQKSAPKPLASNISPGARDGELDPATIEACAKIADKLYEDPAWSPHYQNASATIACKIRRLAKKTRLAAAPQQGEPVWRKTLEEFAEVWGNSLMGLQTGDDVAEWIHNTLIPEMEDVASPAPDVAVGSVEWSKRYNAETDRLVAVKALEGIKNLVANNRTHDVLDQVTAACDAALTSRVSAPVAASPALDPATVCADCGKDEPCDENCPNHQTQEPGPNDREIRTGAHVLQMAKSFGWKDDGEGALEFILRFARQVAFEDCGVNTRPVSQTNSTENECKFPECDCPGSPLDPLCAFSSNVRADK